MTAQPDLILRLRETTTPNVRLYREAAAALECALADLKEAEETAQFYKAEASAPRLCCADLAAAKEERDDWKLRASDRREQAELMETRLTERNASLTRDLTAAKEAEKRLLYIAENLFQMVPQSAWREQGGDDGQGHYEGDYHAEKIRDELAQYRNVLARLEGTQP